MLLKFQYLQLHGGFTFMSLPCFTENLTVWGFFASLSELRDGVEVLKSSL